METLKLMSNAKKMLITTSLSVL